MTASVWIDLILVAILITAVYLGAQRGLMRAVAGIGGTLLGFVGAFALCNRVSPLTQKLILPFVQRMVRNTAESTGLSDILNSPLVNETKEGFRTLLEALHITQADAAVENAAGAGQTVLDAAAGSLAAQLAPIITFVLLLVGIKLIVSLAAKLLSMNIPVIRTLNKGAGALLGALSGMIVVIVLCFGVLQYAPEQDAGIFSQQALRQSAVGGFVANMLE